MASADKQLITYFWWESMIIPDRSLPAQWRKIWQLHHVNDSGMNGTGLEIHLFPTNITRSELAGSYLPPGATVKLMPTTLPLLDN